MFRKTFFFKKVFKTFFKTFQDLFKTFFYKMFFKSFQNLGLIFKYGNSNDLVNEVCFSLHSPGNSSDVVTQCTWHTTSV